MGLDGVIEGILAKGKAEAEDILRQAREERERMLSKVRAEAEAHLAEREKEARALVERRRVQDLARAELEAKRAVLNGQKELLDRVRSEALKALATLPDRDALLRALLTRYAAEWKGGKVYADARDAPLVKAAVAASFAGTLDGAGGIVIESADGKRRIDLRYETLLDDVWDDVIKEVAGTLWPGG